MQNMNGFLVQRTFSACNKAGKKRLFNQTLVKRSIEHYGLYEFYEQSFVGTQCVNILRGAL